MTSLDQRAASSLPDWRRYYNQLTTGPDREGLARRTFLQGMLAAGTIGAAGLQMVAGAPRAQALGPDENVLVVVLFGGGNDGYSMLVPADDDAYVSARQGLALPPEQGIALSNAPGLYWNGSLPGLAARYEAGDVAVVQGIGDPVDDHSHFSSMARWMRGTADTGGGLGFTGWLGRWLDGAGVSELGGIAVGDAGVPLHMRGNNSAVTSLSSYGNLYGSTVESWEIPAFDALQAMDAGASGGFWPDAVAAALADATGTASVIAPIYTDDLPDPGIVRDLALAAETINLDIGARVVTVAFGDFDTHEGHGPRYQDLMASFDAALAGFFARLDPTFADRVSVMTFSEFGRSWTANNSAGIDHGTASNAFVIGNAVKGGLYGQQPDFVALDSLGDLESTVDFRQYYATIIDTWLGGDSSQIVGDSYDDLGIFTTGPIGSHVAGDTNCDGEMSILDALTIAQYTSGLRTDGGSCPLTDPVTQIHAAAGDISGDGATTVIDALAIAQCVVGLDNGLCPPE